MNHPPLFTSNGGKDLTIPHDGNEEKYTRRLCDMIRSRWLRCGVKVSVAAVEVKRTYTASRWDTKERRRVEETHSRTFWEIKSDLVNGMPRVSA